MRRAAVVAAALAVAVGPAASAAPAPAGAHAPAGAPTREQQAAQVRAYWTVARRAVALPGERLVTAVPTSRFARRSGLSEYLSLLTPAPVPARLVSTGSAWTRGGRVARTTGKVFFTLGGSDYVCSGSAVSSSDRSTVLTAGHCVVDPETGALATRWVFVPGYTRTGTPYGMFPATHLAPASGWRTAQDYDVDLAFVNVDRNAAGRLLTDAVGGQAIAFDAPRGGTAVAVGYPARTPWDGHSLVGCAGALRQDATTRPTTDQGMACTMTGGSSGGPWLRGLDPVTGRGTLVSVTSFSYSDLPGVLWGPYLGPVARALFVRVAGTTTA